MAKIGDLREIRGELEIEWSIENFPSLLENEGYDEYDSSPFYFAGASWYMKVYPKGKKKDGDNAKKWISVSLVRASSGSPINLEYVLGVKTSKGEKSMLISDSDIYNKIYQGYRLKEFLNINNLMDKEDELMPSGILTITCTLKNKEHSDVKKSLLSRLLDVVHRLEELFIHRRNTDLILNLQNDEKLHVHRMIIEDRSPIFSHYLKENQTSQIDMKDIDRLSMTAILYYMYTGDIPTLTIENVFPIYVAAQKHDVADVKQFCLTFIQSEMSEKWICDIIKFADDQKDENLACHAKEYFIENAVKILETDHWKTFVKENLDKSMELLSSLVKKVVIK